MRFEKRGFHESFLNPYTRVKEGRELRSKSLHKSFLNLVEENDLELWLFLFFDDIKQSFYTRLVVRQSCHNEMVE